MPVTDEKRERIVNHNIFFGAPPEEPDDIIAWAESNVRLAGSVLSEHYDSSLTPWTIDPIRAIRDDDTRIVTLVKPIQTGGSRVGLIALCWWAKFGFGFIQYNWDRDDKAGEKWQRETLPTLERCAPLEWAGNRYDATICNATFIRTFIKAQGVFTPENLDSDSIPYQINEEVHAWKGGHLAKARGRQTAVLFPKAIDISNAGIIGDQLHQSFENGTSQRWQVKCPGCGNYHIMRTRWDDKRPDLGGLRYDAEGCRLDSGLYNYNKLLRTIRYQMPCGHIVHEHASERRALSLSGRYSPPSNEGALASHKSFTYEAVAVDFIPWLTLIREKHDALRALKRGDNEPWKKYIQERECAFYDRKADNPFIGKIVVNNTRSKSREGLAGRSARFFALDRQKGLHREGETPHYWMVIRDVMPNGDSELVFEGKLYTEQDISSTLDEYGCVRTGGSVDATWDTSNVTDMAFRLGIHCLFSTPEPSFSHGKIGRKIFSREEPLHRYLNRPPKYDYVLQPTEAGDMDLQPDPREPLYWRISKFGIMDRLGWIRGDKSSVKWEVPGDVSEDYRKQIDSWQFVKLPRENSRTREEQYGWQQVATHDHLHYCECCIVLFMEMAGLIGVLSGTTLSETQETTENNG